MSGKLKVPAQEARFVKNMVAVSKGPGGILIMPDAKITSQKYAVNEPTVTTLIGPQATSGADNAVNSIWFCGSNNYLIQHSITAQAIFGPVCEAAGMDITGDVTAVAGKELLGTDGINCAAIEGHNAFTIGTSPAFYLKCAFSLSDITKMTTLHVGFRKLEAHGHAVADYADYITAEFALGAFAQETNVGDGTADTDLDASYDAVNSTTKNIEITVSESGVAVLKVDGVVATGVDGLSEYTFTDGLQVTPFIHFVRANNTDACAVKVSALEFGIEAGRGQVYA
tara:strand:- start:70 stop:918 length:849 start_codon:yes stop_codon:yes gene_type:complete